MFAVHGHAVAARRPAVPGIADTHAGLDGGLMALTRRSPSGGDRRLTLQSGHRQQH